MMFGVARRAADSCFRRYALDQCPLDVPPVVVGKDRGADRASNDADVSSIPPIIPYTGFSLSTAGRLAFGTVPSWVMDGLSQLPAFAVRHPVCSALHATRGRCDGPPESGLRTR
jgi:hypothetical protein